MKRWLFSVFFIVQFLVLTGQERDTPLLLLKNLRNSGPEFDKLLDSLAMINTQHNFNGQLLVNPNLYTRNKYDSVYKESIEFDRLQHLFGDYSDFKRKFLALKIKDNYIDLKLPSMKYYSAKGSLVFSGPVSFFYNAFSKEAQYIKKLEELQAYEPKQHKINSKYNKENIQHWTGLKGDELTKFVVFCHFDDTCLLSTSEYDLVKKVMAKLNEFKALNDTLTN